MGSKRLTSKRVGSPDFMLILLTLILLCLGIVMVFSSSVGSLVGNTSAVNHVDIYKYFEQQILWAVIGSASMIFFMNFNHKALKKLAPTILLIGIVALVLVYIPALGGSSQRGSARWLNFRIITVQPSESIKLALAIFVATVLADRGVRNLKSLLLPFGVVGVCLALVIKQPDLGTTMVIVLMVLSMLFTAGLALRYFVPIFALGGIGVYYVIHHTSYMMDRIKVWFNPWQSAQGGGYQTVNALMSLGSGGIFGVGLGRGMQKFGHLPENHTDMIFAVIGEELGLIGTTAVIALFVLLVWRGLTIAQRVKEPFSRYLAVGITCMVGFQAVINIGVVTGLLPVTGVTLPFISYGGSSLVLLLSGVGILLNISRYAEPMVLTEQKPETSQSL